MPLLFSYGTLQNETVQLSTFGRSFHGQRDELPRYEPSLVKIDDPKIAAEMGLTHYANVRFTGRAEDRVSGTAFEVTDAELAAADAYEEDAAYDRIPVVLASGRESWVYVRTPASVIRRSYDAAAEGYADHLAKELDGKPLDRHLLNRFAEDVRGRGLVGDLGCGPGHVAGYLHERGVQMIGIDLSPEMVRVARRLNPAIEFRTGDMTALDLDTGRLAGIMAFYSIVHFDPAELRQVFAEMRRVLKADGLLLVAFHVGEEVVRVDELFGAPVSLDFRFHQPGQVVHQLRESGFKVLEQAEREPYEGAEYPSRRCYLLARGEAI